MYNQNENEYANDCTIFTIYQLLSLQYGLTPSYTYIDKTIDLALKAKVLFKGGAIFEDIYNWYVQRLSDKLDLRFKISKFNLYKPKFEKLYHKDIYYGVRLRKGNQAYIDAVNRGRISLNDIDDIVSYKKKGFQHNTLFGKGLIHEIYLGKTCKISHHVFKYGLDKGVFGTIGRIILPDSMFAKEVSKQLRNLKDNPNYTAKFSKLQQQAYDKARKIIKMYK